MTDYCDGNKYVAPRGTGISLVTCPWCKDPWCAVGDRPPCEMKRRLKIDCGEHGAVLP